MTFFIKFRIDFRPMHQKAARPATSETFLEPLLNVRIVVPQCSLLIKVSLQRVVAIWCVIMPAEDWAASISCSDMMISKNAFLKFCVGLNFKDLLSANDDKRETQLTLLKGRLVSVKAKLKETNNKIENLGNALGGESNQKLQNFIKKQLAETLDQQDVLKKESKQLASKIGRLSNDKKEAKKQASALHDLITFMQNEGQAKLLMSGYV